MALAKVATADDVAAQVVALSSPLISGHVTGQVVTVAGGMEGRVIHVERACGARGSEPAASHPPPTEAADDFDDAA